MYKEILRACCPMLVDIWEVTVKDLNKMLEKKKERWLIDDDEIKIQKISADFNYEEMLLILW